MCFTHGNNFLARIGIMFWIWWMFITCFSLFVVFLINLWHKMDHFYILLNIIYNGLVYPLLQEIKKETLKPIVLVLRECDQLLVPSMLILVYAILWYFVFVFTLQITVNFTAMWQQGKIWTNSKVWTKQTDAEQTK